jgi:hypothetical protein
MKRRIIFLGLALVLANVFYATSAEPDQRKKPNILIIWGDDIGWFNPSCYHNWVMGYQTPNIDRIAKEGARFTECQTKFSRGGKQITES